MNTLRRWQCFFVILLTIPAIAAYQDDHQEKRRGKSPPGENVLWVDPGDVASLDFEYGVGGPKHQPQPPFRFVKEDMSGTRAKVFVTDAGGRTWNVKWGHEARSSVFCTRLVWACGYVTAPEYFVAQGNIEGVHGLKRAKSDVADDGSFSSARFQLRTDSPKFLADAEWTLSQNPFLGAKELQGLKILMLLVSNWDKKNSNFGIFEDNASGRLRYLYSNIDWGGSLGNWGNPVTRKKWDYRKFADQTTDFVKGVKDGRIEWGLGPKSVTDDITVADVQWLLQYLGKITDKQIHVGLEASGAAPNETLSYAQALRQRIQQLQEATIKVPAQTAHD